jgi:3',5'-nucleoside bisphosphate phosphatase
VHIRADLHLHTRASDGDLSPEGVASLAKAASLDAIAITDHDTIAGARSAREAGERYGLLVIPGVEVSIAHDPGTLHILGYFPAYPAAFEQVLERLQHARVVRLPQIIERLKALGVEISASEVTDIADGGQVGRPHVAKALMKKGYVRAFEDAFTRYLGKGKPAYVEKDRINSGEAIEAIRASGGVAVLAHPSTVGLAGRELKAFVQRLKDQGLQGVEIFYPDHTRPQKKLYLEVARELDLVATGGTDFHSPTPGGVMPGRYGLDKNGYALFLEKLFPA